VTCNKMAMTSNRCALYTKNGPWVSAAKCPVKAPRRVAWSVHRGSALSSHDPTHRSSPGINQRPRYRNNYFSRKLGSQIPASGPSPRAVSLIGTESGFLATRCNLGELCLAQGCFKHSIIKKSSRIAYCVAILIRVLVSCKKGTVRYATDPDLI
jgi:hypothetical protein